jgi:hypothetical protein
MRRVLVSALVLLFTAAPFGGAFAQAGFPTLRFNGEPPFRLAVGSIQIVNRDPSPGRPPRIDQRFPIPPARAIETWAHDRLVAAGGPDRLIVTIVRGRALDTPLRMDAGSLSSSATDQQSDRFDVEAEVRLDIVDPRGVPVANVRAVATRYQTVLESTTPDQVDNIWYEMVRAVMAQLAPRLDSEIRRHWAAYLR